MPPAGNTRSPRGSRTTRVYTPGLLTLAGPGGLQGGCNAHGPLPACSGSTLTGRGSSSSAPFSTGSASPSLGGALFLDFFWSLERSSLSFLCFFFLCLEGF